jgi:hypothetical protein
MLWKCPACGVDIRHHDAEPRYGVVYRCHICRLELVLEREALKLTVAPLPSAAHDADPQRSPRHRPKPA